MMQSYEKFPNYANIFAIIFANNCKNFSSSIIHHPSNIMLY